MIESDKKITGIHKRELVGVAEHDVLMEIVLMEDVNADPDTRESFVTNVNIFFFL